MDILFQCPSCQTELEVDASAGGSEIACPSCNETLLIPLTNAPPPPPAAAPGAPANPRPPTVTLPPVAPAALGAGPGAGKVVNAMASSAAAKEVKYFKVPVHDAPAESLIQKANRPLDAEARDPGDRHTRIKTMRHSDYVDVGHDHFEESVNKFLTKVGDENIISITTFTYTHQELASRQWISDYGVLVVYKG